MEKNIRKGFDAVLQLIPVPGSSWACAHSLPSSLPIFPSDWLLFALFANFQILSVFGHVFRLDKTRDKSFSKARYWFYSPFWPSKMHLDFSFRRRRLRKSEIRSIIARKIFNFFCERFYFPERALFDATIILINIRPTTWIALNVTCRTSRSY